MNYKKLIADEYEAMRKREEADKLKAKGAEKDKESECVKGEKKSKMEVC